MKKVREFTATSDHGIDSQINKFVELNHVELIDVKYQMFINGQFTYACGLLIYEVADK